MRKILEENQLKANKNIQNYIKYPNFKVKHVIYFPLYFWYLREEKYTELWKVIQVVGCPFGPG